MADKIQILRTFIPYSRLPSQQKYMRTFPKPLFHKSFNAFFALWWTFYMKFLNRFPKNQPVFYEILINKT